VLKLEFLKGLKEFRTLAVVEIIRRAMMKRKVFQEVILNLIILLCQLTYLPTGQQDNFKTTSWCSDPPDKCSWLFVVFYNK